MDEERTKAALAAATTSEMDFAAGTAA
jgi:hypothetical protein